MKIMQLHPWNVSPREAIEIQKRLQPFLDIKKLSSTIRHVAGTDVSCSRRSNIVWAGVVVFSYPDLNRVEERWIKDKADFPYIPGLLSFRELPAIINAVKKLKSSPDLILCDGQGIAHPRGLGLASHLGLILNIPTIGCAKSVLCGEFSRVGNKRGDYAYLRYKGHIIGSALRTRTGVRPVFVSPGNMINLKGSMDIVVGSCGRYRIPEPIRQAHLMVNDIRKREGG